MTATSWQQVAARLRKVTAGPTAEQVSLGRALNLSIAPTTPEPVAAALLRCHLNQPLGLSPIVLPTDGSLEYLHDLAARISFDVPTDLDDQEAVNSWIKVIHAKRAVDCLEELHPEPGDVVEVAKSGGSFLAELASISLDGQLNFRGGYGHRARPHQVTIFARVSDAGYEEARYLAKQYAASRINDPQITGAKQIAELAKWRVDGDPSEAAFIALVEALDSAGDERPMQAVLEAHPEILARLVSGHRGAYVIPRPSFREYVPDFLVAGCTSAGIWWTLVELESPSVGLSIKDGQPSRQVRKALQQIADWREWLKRNLDYARRRTAEGGLGLVGIRDDARGLVLVGRGQVSSEVDVMRLRIEHEQRVLIRTYDWLARESERGRPLRLGILDDELPDFAEE